MHWACRKITDFTEIELQQTYMQLSPSRKVRIDRLRRQEDKVRSLAAERLVYQLLKKHFGITAVKLLCKSSGQPYLADCPLHVSISHCEQAVACAVSHTPVGIDMERIRPIDLRLCRHTCVPEEMEYLRAGERCGDQEVFRRFFEIWTAKEAYYKKCGTGITDLKGINILTLQRQVYTMDDYLIQII
jgi:4'-phosphopantetheinyl transferase